MKKKPRIVLLAPLAIGGAAYAYGAVYPIGFDLLFLCAFSLVATTLATRLFRRTL